MTASAQIPEIEPVGAEPFRLRLAAEVRAHLARRRWSQRHLARVLGVTAPWVQRRLDGTTPMTVDDMELFATTLGLTIPQLIGRAAQAVEPDGINYG